MRERKHRIAQVDADSIAQELGIEPGDLLVAINGQPLVDLMDYQYYQALEELTLTVEDAAGERYELEVEKDAEEPLGLGFDQPLMDRARVCRNRCLFCFVDQLPSGVRPSLRVKDDDWRMSLMMGNYVTLTNVDEQEFARILRLRVQPLYISVHATEPELRCRLLRNPNGGNLLERLGRLAAAQLSFHSQVVLCPGYNDREHLERTLEDLYALRPYARTLAVVPVGLTGHREGLEPLRRLTAQEARDTVAQIEAFNRRAQADWGEDFVFASDELYLQGDLPLPSAERYGEFEQIEDGVGLVSLLERQFSQALQAAAQAHVAPEPRRVTVVTGVSAGPLLQDLAGRMQAAYPQVRAEVVPVENHFFGPSITVAGLVTGGDILRALAGRALGQAVLVPQVMLREQEDVFLDDMTLTELTDKLGAPVHKVPVDGWNLAEGLLGQPLGEIE